MKSKFSSERFDLAEATEFSLGLGMLLAIGVFLGSMAVRHAELPFAHAQMHVAQIQGDAVA